MENIFVKNHFVGRDGFIWWIGQIPNEEVWKENKTGFPQSNNEECPGFAERYKVRIMGYHTAVPSELEDSELPWATVMYPVTAGGGGRAAYQNANLTQGCWVFGFFIDGDQCQTPVIMGALGYNDYNTVMKNVPDAKFVPFSGYTPKDKMATTGTKAEESEGYVAEISQEGGANNNANITESTGGDSTITSHASDVMRTDGQKKEPVEQPQDCRPIPTAKIQQITKNLLHEVEQLKRAKTERRYALVKETSEYDEVIKKKVAEASEQIAGSMKQIMAEVQKNTTEKINDKLKSTYDKVFPNERQALKKEVESINDAIACQFRNIAGGLMDMLKNFLGDAVNKLVNAASCFIDNMVGAMMGTLSNAIENSLGSIFGALNGMTGLSISFPGGEALGIIQDVLSFLQCEENPACSQTSEMSLWDGNASTPSMGAGDIGKLAGSFSNIFGKLPIPELDIPNLPFGDVFGHNSCDTGPIKCGPPILDIFGGAGKGAAGNLIVSRLGEILGADMKSYGTNYDDAAQARVLDHCGIGQGAQIEPIIGPWTDENGDEQIGVLDIRVMQPGINYLGQLDGSTGGDGRVWARPDDTSVTHSNGDLEIPRPPGTIISVVPGDTVLMPPGTEITTEPLSPTDVQDIMIETPIIGREIFGTTDEDIIASQLAGTTATIGVGGAEKIPGGKPYVMKSAGKFTTPSLPVKQESGVYPTESSGAYPAILTLCDIIIESPGYGYKEGDEIIIEPNAGATVVPTYSDIGVLMSVKITDGGQGFTESPDIYIKSETGFNAVLLPKFCVERIASDEFVDYKPSQDKLVSIVDCVGVVPPPQRTIKEPGVTRRAYADSTTGFTPPNAVQLIGIETPEDDT